ncbi:fatty acid desaturase [Achromobacter sp. AGC39]
MNTLASPDTICQFDKNIYTLSRWQHIRRCSYFTLVGFLSIYGTAITIPLLWRNPYDALYVLPIAILGAAFGVNTACHMYFTHRTFRTGQKFRGLLALLGTLVCQDPIILWAANHVRHHRYVDIPHKDPHTPLQFGQFWIIKWTAGLWWASIGWKFSKIVSSKSNFPNDLKNDKMVSWFDRHFSSVSLAGLWLPYAIGFAYGGADTALKYFAYFGGFRVFVGYFITEFVINGLCHTIGSNKFRAAGHAKNLSWLSPLTFGATLHHNHHAFPDALSPAIDGEIDTMNIFYKPLENFKIISTPHTPSAAEIESKRLT